MRNTNAINFICRKSKTDKNGYSPILMSISINCERTTIQLPRKEKPDVFRKEKMKPNSGLRKYLDAMKRKVDDLELMMMMNDIPITAISVKNNWLCDGKQSFTIEKMFDDYLGILRARIGIDLTQSTFRKYERLKDHFLDAMGKGTQASDITPTDISRYYADLNRNEKLSTTAGKMTKLKTIFSWAKDCGKITALPFAGIKIHKPRPSIEFLTEIELDRIYRHKFSCERLEKVKALLVFQAGTGLSYADMAELHPDDVQFYDDVAYIKKKRKKTNIDFTSILMAPALKVWRKFNGALPLLSNQKYNAYLKEIQDICGIRKNITSHILRKTYATMLVNSGVSMVTVSKCLGHSNSRVTESTYAFLLDSTIIEEVKKVI